MALASEQPTASPLHVEVTIAGRTGIGPTTRRRAGQDVPRPGRRRVHRADHRDHRADQVSHRSDLHPRNLLTQPSAKPPSPVSHRSDPPTAYMSGWVGSVRYLSS